MFNKDITNSDFIKCQLTVDFIDGVFASIDEVYPSLGLENSELNNGSQISGGIEEIAGVTVVSLVTNLISPLACMDRIAYGNEDLIGLPSFDTILKVLKWGALWKKYYRFYFY